MSLKDELDRIVEEIEQEIQYRADKMYEEVTQPQEDADNGESEEQEAENGD